MGMIFDTLKFQNGQIRGNTMPVVAEIGVIVDDYPSEFYENGEEKSDVIPCRVDPGYYYVAMTKPFGSDHGYNFKDSKKGSRYLVARESIFEYIYGYANQDEPPEFLEKYDRLAEACNSEFIDFFRYMNQLIHESEDDRALINNGVHNSKPALIKTEIDIASLEEFNIITKAAFVDSPDTELEYKIQMKTSDDIGLAIDTGDDMPLLIPKTWLSVCDNNKNELKKYPAIDYVDDTRLLVRFGEMECYAVDRIKAYFKEKEADLSKRFTPGKLKGLENGILSCALGVKNWDE